MDDKELIKIFERYHNLFAALISQPHNYWEDAANELKKNVDSLKKLKEGK